MLLGHHRRDQAETVLLQALRGGGPAGLAAMPRVALRGGLTWARPWLGVAPQRIEAYARAHALDWVDDDSNTDTRLRRNRLRHAVWPALEAAFADAEPALAAVAAHAAEALACADELAAIDLPALDAGEGGLRIADWLRLSAVRRGNALRAWLRREGGGPAPASLVARLLDELPAGDAPARWPAPGGRMLRRHGGALRWGAARRGGAAATAAPLDAAAPPGAALRPCGAAAQTAVAGVRLPGWGGRLCWSPVDAGGLAADALGRLRVAARVGGERFQLGPGRPPRGLKKQFQALGVPAWRRDGPLAWLGDALVYVPGLGHDARTLAPAGSPQVALSWQPDPAGGARPGAPQQGVPRAGEVGRRTEDGRRRRPGTARHGPAAAADSHGPAVNAARRRGRAVASR